MNGARFVHDRLEASLPHRWSASTSPNAVAELRYLRVLAALIDREHRPLFSGGGEDGRCRVLGQDPPPSTEVVLDEITVTVKITIRCPALRRRRIARRGFKTARSGGVAVRLG
jgi:hypothetical protein